MRVKVKRTVGKMMNRQVAGAFGRWAEMTEEAKVGCCTVQLQPGLPVLWFQCLKLKYDANPFQTLRCKLNTGLIPG